MLWFSFGTPPFRQLSEYFYFLILTNQIEFVCHKIRNSLVWRPFFLFYSSFNIRRFQFSNIFISTPLNIFISAMENPNQKKKKKKKMEKNPSYFNSGSCFIFWNAFFSVYFRNTIIRGYSKNGIFFLRLKWKKLVKK